MIISDAWLWQATSASIGDSPKISLADARELQKRRVLRLALKLASKLEPWVAGDNDACKAMWITEAEVLSTASYGIPLIHLLGKVCMYIFFVLKTHFCHNQISATVIIDLHLYTRAF